MLSCVPAFGKSEMLNLLHGEEVGYWYTCIVNQSLFDKLYVIITFMSHNFAVDILWFLKFHNPPDSV